MTAAAILACTFAGTWAVLCAGGVAASVVVSLTIRHRIQTTAGVTDRLPVRSNPPAACRCHRRTCVSAGEQEHLA